MDHLMQKYCLRWNNYQTNLVKVFDEMLKNENFADVTIVCNNGIRFRCHRMLLAACSKFFQDIFISVPCEQHLVVLLKDVKHTDMKHILEYMYTGEVNVAQEDISSIIRTAEDLKIKGLIGEDKVAKKEEEPIEDVPPSRPSSDHVHSSSNIHSPPHSTNAMYKNPYSNMYSKMHTNERSNMPMWHVPGLPLPPASESPSSNHFSVPSPPTVMPTYEQHNQEVYHHRRKKFSSMMMPKDTPILRTVLGQGQADSSQPVSLVMNHAETKEDNHDQEPIRKRLKEEPQEDNDYHNEEDVKPRIIVPSSSPVTHPAAGITAYTQAQTQKPETNKRYKQYSNNDLNQALDDVRSGMSALTAAKRHNVPSRTLYDKVKKMGIKTTNPNQSVKLGKRSSNGNPVEYNSDERSVSPRGKSESEDYPINNNSSVTKAFLQHAGEDALKAMAYAASVAQALQIPNNAFGGTRAAAMRYHPPYNRYSPHSPANSDNRSVTPDKEPDYDEDHVEDLSMNKRQEGVIVPPMNQVSAIVNEEAQRNRKEDSRRNVEETTLRLNRHREVSYQLRAAITTTHMKEEVLDDAPSPYSDQHSTNGEDVKPNLSVSSSLTVSHSYPNDMRLGIANYVPAQKPEWKRYKQYSRENLNCAIQAVADGNMSALQAAKKYNVPSRTLYDKVKKLGIVTTRSFKRGSQGNFRYLANRQTDSPYHTSENEESPTNNNSRHFFQRTIDKNGEVALKTMAMVAAMQAAASQHQSQNMSPTGFDPSSNAALFRYMHKRTLSLEEDQHERSYDRPGEDQHLKDESYTQPQVPHRSPSVDDHNSEMSVDHDEDQVEDLSVKKRQEGVIVSPLPKNEDTVKKDMSEEERQEMCVEEVRQLKI